VLAKWRALCYVRLVGTKKDFSKLTWSLVESKKDLKSPFRLNKTLQTKKDFSKLTWSLVENKKDIKSPFRLNKTLASSRRMRNVSSAYCLWGHAHTLSALPGKMIHSPMDQHIMTQHPSILTLTSFDDSRWLRCYFDVKPNPLVSLWNYLIRHIWIIENRIYICSRRPFYCRLVLEAEVYSNLSWAESLTWLGRPC
jgi:hypothetical protein